MGTTTSKKPRLLSGGNPQIPKGDGDEPVRAYIDAMPGWKRDVGRYLDDLIVRTVPDVRKAVRWNSPFYGIEGNGWFLSLHCFTAYVKVTWLNGSSLDPLPPGESKHERVRYLDIHEDEGLDEQLMVSWVRQAAGRRSVLSRSPRLRSCATGSCAPCRRWLQDRISHGQGRAATLGAMEDPRPTNAEMARLVAMLEDAARRGLHRRRGTRVLPGDR